MIFHLMVTMLLTLSLNALAQNKIHTSKVIEITYGSSPWNTNEHEKDVAFLFIQDRNTKKTVKVFLEETSKDSAIFKGKFSLNIDEGHKFAPAIFIPPTNLRQVKSHDSFYSLLKQQKIKRQPIVFKKQKPFSRLEVFDTKEQATAAVNALKKEYLAKRNKKKNINAKQVNDVSQSKQDLLNDLAIKSAQQEMERLRLSQLEKQKILEKIKKQKALKQGLLNKNKLEAEEIAHQALVEYKKENYPMAEDLFKKSIDLNPTNTSYYFKYGVTLYRNNKLNDALVIFDIVKSDNSNEDLEKRYYMAMIHYKLEELDKAIEHFQYVKSQDHSVLSPSSAFYNGVISFGKEDYKESKANFEYVLDTSKDPKLDNKAEDFIEKIAMIEQFKSQQSLKNTVMALVGVGYDSNVLNSPDNTDQGTATNVDTPRLLALGAYERRLIYKLKHELTAKITSLYMYSIDDSAVPADPFIVTTQLPYSYKSTLFNKGYKLTITPGYESLFMDVQSTGTRDQILGSFLLNINNTFIINNNWQSQYILDIRQDDSFLTEDTTDNNADALKYSLKTNQYYFLDKSKRTAVTANLGYTTNDAVGKNKAYNRIDLTLGYMSYINSLKTSYNINLNTYILNYDGANNREEKSYSLSTSFNRPINDWFIASTNLNYTKNESNLDAYAYQKYTIMINAIFNYSF